jgi:DUF917 family protein
MYTLSKNDLPILAKGAAILGSGGGGNPKVLLDLVHHQMSQHGDVSIISTDELPDNCLIVPIAFVGAPLISMEKIPSMKIFTALYEKIRKDFPTQQIVLMPAEIGGCNALTPFMLASKYGLPILDADLIGRAFPKLNMCKPAILDYQADPTYLTDFHGNAITLHPQKIDALEDMVREVVVRFSSTAIIATFILTRDHTDKVIPGSISRSLELGKNALPLNTIQLARGYINDIHHQLAGGFLTGHAVIKTAQHDIKIYFQNEFLLAKHKNETIAASPEIIAIIDAKSGIVITTESLQFGIEVILLKIPAPDFWLSPQALPVVHPNVFNLE